MFNLFTFAQIKSYIAAPGAFTLLYAAEEINCISVLIFTGTQKQIKAEMDSIGEEKSSRSCSHISTTVSKKLSTKSIESISVLFTYSTFICQHVPNRESVGRMKNTFVDDKMLKQEIRHTGMQCSGERVCFPLSSAHFLHILSAGGV